MTEVLVEELLDSDITWIVQKGQRQQLSAQQVLIRQGQTLDSFYIVLSGILESSIADNLVGGPDAGLSLIQFSVGEIVGEMGCLRSPTSTITIQAQEDSIVLEVPYAALQIRLQQDPAFASRFYRALAILLLSRFEYMVDKFSRRRGLQISLMQDAPVLLGELHDSDIDWMIEHGTVQEAYPEQAIIHAGRTIDTLYIVLYGELSVSMVAQKRSDLSAIFSQLLGSEETAGRQIARAGKGEMIGETALLNSRLSNMVVKARKPSVLLALPRSQLAIKLQQDSAMGARFYRVMAIVLADRLDGLIGRLSYPSRSYSAGQSLTATEHYEDELDLDTIDNLNLAGARFDWMLKRLNVRGA